MSSYKGIRHLENGKRKYKAQRDLGASACYDYITSLLLIHEYQSYETLRRCQ